MALRLDYISSCCIFCNIQYIRVIEFIKILLLLLSSTTMLCGPAFHYSINQTLSRLLLQSFHEVIAIVFESQYLSSLKDLSHPSTEASIVATTDDKTQCISSMQSLGFPLQKSTVQGKVTPNELRVLSRQTSASMMS